MSPEPVSYRRHRFFHRDQPRASVTMDGVDVYLRHDRRRADAAFRADPRRTGTPIVTPVARRPWQRAALRPNARDAALLADARFIREPQFQWLVRHPFEVALKTAWVTSVNVVEIMV